MKTTYFISGIDTDAGKTFATAWLAKKWKEEGKNVITQKFIQTGCRGISEDIESHRRLMGLPLQEVDHDGTTCPIILSYPASPHLAAKIDNYEINLDLVRRSTRKLHERYDIVLLEGAGGLMVPVTEDYNTIDYIVEEGLPLIFVTSAKLGSINHTLLALDACTRRGICIESIIFNNYPAQDSRMLEDSREFIKKKVRQLSPSTTWHELPFVR